MTERYMVSRKLSYKMIKESMTKQEKHTNNHRKCTIRRLQYGTERKDMRGWTTSRLNQVRRRHSTMHHLKENTGLRHIDTTQLLLERTLCLNQGALTLPASRDDERRIFLHVQDRCKQYGGSPYHSEHATATERLHSPMTNPKGS